MIRCFNENVALLFSHLVDGGHYPPPQVAYPYPHPGGYPPHGYPPSSGYPPAAYPHSSGHYYSGHGGHGHGHGHGVGTFLAGGAAAVAAGYGVHHMPHHGYGSHGYGYHGHYHHHGKFKHYKFKSAKFGKRWKHGGLYGRHKMWK